MARIVKQTPKARNPRIVSINSAKPFGTSSETTSNVSAKPKTASLNDSSRVTSRPRRRNPGRSRDSLDCVMCDYARSKSFSQLRKGVALTELCALDRQHLAKHADVFGESHD